MGKVRKSGKDEETKVGDAIEGKRVIKNSCEEIAGVEIEEMKDESTWETLGKGERVTEKRNED